MAEKGGFYERKWLNPDGQESSFIECHIDSFDEFVEGTSSRPYYGLSANVVIGGDHPHGCSCVDFDIDDEDGTGPDTLSARVGKVDVVIQALQNFRRALIDSEAQMTAEQEKYDAWRQENGGL